MSQAYHRNLNRLKDAYYACVDVQKIIQKGSNLLGDIIDEIVHLFRVQTSKNVTDAVAAFTYEELANVSTYLAKLDVWGLVTMEVGPHSRHQVRSLQ